MRPPFLIKEREGLESAILGLLSAGFVKLQVEFGVSDGRASLALASAKPSTRRSQLCARRSTQTLQLPERQNNTEKC